MEVRPLKNQKSNLKPVAILSNEWFILRFLKDWTTHDINLAIQKDVDLEKIITDNPDQAKMLSSSANLFDPSWGVGDILYWFSVRRPDLYKRLTEKDGIIWITKHYRKRMKIKRKLLNI